MPTEIAMRPSAGYCPAIQFQVGIFHLITEVITLTMAIE
jgi:hypothetical protein